MSGVEMGVLVSSVTTSLIAVIGAIFGGLKILAELKINALQLKQETRHAAVQLAAKTEQAARDVTTQTIKIAEAAQQERGQMHEELKENTHLTRETAEKAHAALEAANNINNKIANNQEAIIKVQDQVKNTLPEAKTP